MAVSASETTLAAWRFIPTVPEKTRKLSSSEVVSTTRCSWALIPWRSNRRMVSGFDLIIWIANSIANLRILGTLTDGRSYLSSVETTFSASLSSVTVAV